MIEAKNLVKKFRQGENQFTILDKINLKVKKGEFLAITGRSGAGKSTLLYQLSLLDQPTAGQVIIDGFDTSDLSQKQRTSFRLAYLGFVFQDFALMPDLTAIENVALPLLMLGQSFDDTFKKSKKLLKKLGLAERLNNTPGKLSGGQQQRVGIARAIVNKPKILFADEPTASLDRDSAKVIISIFKELNKQGQTIVMVSHEKEYYNKADRVVELSAGKILEKN